jgi:hypothetical protein
MKERERANERDVGLFKTNFILIKFAANLGQNLQFFLRNFDTRKNLPLEPFALTETFQLASNFALSQKSASLFGPLCFSFFVVVDY